MHSFSMFLMPDLEILPGILTPIKTNLRYCPVWDLQACCCLGGCGYKQEAIKETQTLGTATLRSVEQNEYPLTIVMDLQTPESIFSLIKYSIR